MSVVELMTGRRQDEWLELMRFLAFHLYYIPRRNAIDKAISGAPSAGLRCNLRTASGMQVFARHVHQLPRINYQPPIAFDPSHVTVMRLWCKWWRPFTL